ncbi:hypothetical protein DL93DRAFT_1833024 [Clavulina sp. PMI_390]|nr:hypothetical protein DL93DRAFT_1833024 [Clavulina sp. PMI_390]
MWTSGGLAEMLGTRALVSLTLWEIITQSAFDLVEFLLVGSMFWAIGFFWLLRSHPLVSEYFLSLFDRIVPACAAIVPGCSLLKVGLATEGGNKKEVYNVVAIWLRVIATTHQEEVMPVTMLVQQWFNMYGRWPLTLAFFISCMPSGDKPGADLVPPVLRAGTDVYEAAMNFKAHLTLLARTYYAQPMLPLFWEVSP